MVPKDVQTYVAQTYSVREQANGWWAYFTIVPEIGLLQIHSDFGMWDFRWDSPGSDFKAFLIKTDRDYTWHKLESWAHYSECISNRKQEEGLRKRLDRLMDHLWPLFIGQLRSEAAAKEV